MWRFGLRQVARLALGLLGAVLLAAFVSALAAPDAKTGALHFMGAVLSRLLAVARLDFGVSAINDVPASAELAQKLPVTLELVGSGAIVAAIVGMPLGLLLSISRTARAVAPLIQIVAAAPVFCAGLGLLWISVRVFHTTPHAADHLWSTLASGNGPQIRAALGALALPALTVGAAGAASVQLALRRASAGAIEEPYRRGLRLMGLGAFEIDRLYLVPEVLAGLLASLGEISLSLFSAAVVAEWVFGWPGAAALFLKSVALRDWSVVALILFAFGAVTILARFVGALGGRMLGGEAAAP